MEMLDGIALNGGCVDSSRDWVLREFGAINFDDERIDARFFRLMSQLCSSPFASITQACSSRGDVKAAYRFFGNDKVRMGEIMESHRVAVAERMRRHSTILAVQDTAFLNYGEHLKSTGLGTVSTKRKSGPGGLGLVMHSTLALTTSGCPLGLLSLDIWGRDNLNAAPYRSQRKAEQQKVPIEEKESIKWLEALEATAEASSAKTKVITICDREADIYEFFICSNDLKSDVLVRASANRHLEDEAGVRLWPKVSSQPAVAAISVELARKGGEKARKERTATVEIRFAEVTLKTKQPRSLQYAEHKDPVTLTAILASEVGPPEDENPIDWMLLTNLSVKTPDDAKQCVHYYARRPGIEEFHKILKSGCKIEKLQFQNADRLAKCVTMYCVIAYRVLLLTKLNRTEPEAPCTEVLDNDEWRALWTYSTRGMPLPKTIPTVKAVVTAVAMLGGYLNRKNDPPPGSTVLWRGLQQLSGIAAMWSIMANPVKS